jgi:hypothetical protein
VQTSFGYTRVSSEWGKCCIPCVSRGRRLLQGGARARRCDARARPRGLFGLAPLTVSLPRAAPAFTMHPPSPHTSARAPAGPRYPYSTRANFAGQPWSLAVRGLAVWVARARFRGARALALPAPSSTFQRAAAPALLRAPADPAMRVGGLKIVVFAALVGAVIAAGAARRARRAAGQLAKSAAGARDGAVVALAVSADAGAPFDAHAPDGDKIGKTVGSEVIGTLKKAPTTENSAAGAGLISQMQPRLIQLEVRCAARDG